MEKEKQTVTIPLEEYRLHIMQGVLLAAILASNGSAYDREKIIDAARNVLDATLPDCEGGAE